MVMITVIIALRMFAWWGFCLVSRIIDKILRAFNKRRVRKYISRLGKRIEASFPKTAGFLHERLSTGRYTGLPLTLTVIAALYIAALFGGLIEELLEADALVLFDKILNQLLDTIRTDSLIRVFIWVTDLGGSAALAAVVFVASGLLWVHRRRVMIAPLWLIIIGSQATTLAGKYAMARPRPELVANVTAVTPSFPSGHATSAMAVYGFIAYVIFRNLKTTRQRFEAFYWTAVLIGLVGFSRMLLGLHYASDVVAGFLVGSFWLLVGFAVAEYNHNR